MSSHRHGRVAGPCAAALGVAVLASACTAPGTLPGPAAAASAPARSPYDTSYLNGPPPNPPVPSWAFAMDPPATADLRRRSDDDLPRRVPHSTVVDTRRHALDHNDAIDWHPDDHPPAPSIVMYGHKPQPAACAFCHRPNGAGMPENAPLAGLPFNYFVQQVHNFQDKTRKSADMRMASYHGMADVIAPKITEADLREAAAYYASLTLKPYLDVIETATVPVTRSYQYTLKPVEGGGTEPIGNRIIETPRDWSTYELGDSQSVYTVYVPVGSLQRGEALVRTGGDGRTLPCASCHGPDLRGVGDIPPIAGRSPSNLVRQIYNIKVGARASADAAPMRPVVANLSDADIVDIAAYVASRKP